METLAISGLIVLMLIIFTGEGNYPKPDKMETSTIGDIAKKVSRAIAKKRCKSAYNVFESWRMNENDHTKLLLSLLRYQDQYGQMPVLYSFLKRFARGCGKMISKRPDKVEILFSPKYTDGKNCSFIDGLVLMTVGNSRLAFIIENKIYDAPDQNAQIRRYIGHIKNNHHVDLDKIWVFYLTGDGSKTVSIDSYDRYDENEETNIGQHFSELTYSEDIVRWLTEDILLLRTYPESLTSVVRTYVDFIISEFSTTTDESDATEKVMLRSLNLPTELRKMSQQDIEKLYTFQDQVKQLRNNLRNAQDDEEAAATDIEKLYDVVCRSVRTVEGTAFNRFETMSADILNEQWKRELRRDKLSWIVRHRGLAGNKGFVQIALTDEWGSAHMEWCEINAAAMFCKTQYTIELHVECNKPLAKKWHEDLKNNTLLLPANREKVNNGTSRVFRYIVNTPKPFAAMGETMLRDFLQKLYCQQLNYLFRTLINHYKDYGTTSKSRWLYLPHQSK